MSIPIQEKDIPPRSYVFERVGLSSARITERTTQSIGPSVRTTPVPDDAKAKALIPPISDDDEQVPDGAGGYFLKRKKRTYTLYDNNRANESLETATALIRFDLPRYFLFTTLFTEVGGAKRQAGMYKMAGPQPNPWYSINRTLVDFGGVIYKWNTTWFANDLTLVRSGGVVVAQFDTRIFSFDRGVLGTLEVKIPVSESLLQLIICACHRKYQEDYYRRIALCSNS